MTRASQLSKPLMLHQLEKAIEQSVQKVYSSQSHGLISALILSIPSILVRYLMDPAFITIPLEHFVVLHDPVHWEVLPAPWPCSFSQTQWWEDKAFLWNGLLSRTLDHHPRLNQVRLNIEKFHNQTWGPWQTWITYVLFPSSMWLWIRLSIFVIARETLTLLFNNT